MLFLAHDSAVTSVGDLAIVAAAALLAASAPPSARRRLAWAGLVALVAAGSPPVHAWAERSFTGHMVQHLTVIVVAAPLLAPLVADRGPLVGGGRLATALRRRLVAPRAAPAVAAVVHAAVLACWHVPAFYDTTLLSTPVHLLGHGALGATALWWWATLIHHVERRRPLVPLLTLFALATWCAVIGVTLMFGAEPWFAHDDLGDQQLAGALMAGAGFGYGIAAGFVVSRSMALLSEPRRPRLPAPSRLVALAPVAAALLVPQLVSADPADPRPSGRQVPAVAQGATPAAGDELTGRELYRRDCLACHGVDGEGSFRGVAIDEVGTASVRYSLETGRMPIRDHTAPVRRRPPAYGPDQIDAIVAYTDTFVSGPSLPELAGIEGDLVRGGELYRLHCSACHGATGNGGAQAFDRVAPSLMAASATDVATALVAGPGGMPAFGSSFEPDELVSVADYVALLQDPPTTGLRLPGDRVGEGLVAWMVGIGILVAAAAWMARGEA